MCIRSTMFLGSPKSGRGRNKLRFFSTKGLIVASFRLVWATGACVIAFTSSLTAIPSRTSNGSLARIVWYLTELEITSPLTLLINSRSSSVTWAWISTVTRWSSRDSVLFFPDSLLALNSFKSDKSEDSILRCSGVRLRFASRIAPISCKALSLISGERSFSV